MKAGLAELPVSLTLDGSYTALGAFVDQLQQVQPRALLVKAVNMQVGNNNGWTLALDVTVFASGTATK